MTPEELDKARSDEAWRIWERQPDSLPETATIAARLAREGWAPPEPVDPDLLVVREIMAEEYEKAGWPALAKSAREGKLDEHRYMRGALIVYKAGKEAAR
jgi:hypothetical protein